MTSITPFLWFDNNVPEAVAFYKSVFPNAKESKPSMTLWRPSNSRRQEVPTPSMAGPKI